VFVAQHKIQSLFSVKPLHCCVFYLDEYVSSGKLKLYSFVLFSGPAHI